MHPIDIAVVIACITVFGTFAGALVSHYSSKTNTVINMMQSRLEHTEERLDKLEKDLAQERLQRTTLSVYAESLHNWSIRAFEFIKSHKLLFDPPPVRRTLEVSSKEDQ